MKRGRNSIYGKPWGDNEIGGHHQSSSEFGIDRGKTGETGKFCL